MGSDYGVLCTNYLVSVCVHWLVVKNTFQKIYQFVLKHKVREAPVQLGPSELSSITCPVTESSCWHWSLPLLTQNSEVIYQQSWVSQTGVVPAHATKAYMCVCVCIYIYIYIYICLFIYSFILNLGTRWRLSVKRHVPDDITKWKHPTVIPEEQVGWTPVLFWILCCRYKFLPSAWNWPTIPWASNV